MGAVFLAVTSSTLFFTFITTKNFGMVQYFNFFAGAILAAKGIYYEAMADAQLAAWRKRPSGSKTAEDHESTELQSEFGDRVCVDGLWAKSRHPNLWYDLEFWIGIALIGQADMTEPTRILAFLGPLVLFGIMDRL